MDIFQGTCEIALLIHKLGVDGLPSVRDVGLAIVRLSLLIIKVRSLAACTKTVSIWTSLARVADKGD